MNKKLSTVLLIPIWFLLTNTSIAQVVLRDTVINWQHHRFELNEDYSIKTFSTDDNDIQEVLFNSGKVIENGLIKLVLLPEYGGRVLSFIYKPTNHEYLYQSEVGSAYGIGDNNFYFNWLMVYGGIFPTFPEPEHGKTWLVPWEYSIIKQNVDTVTVRMQFTDETAYPGAPGQFNNGITNITCMVDVSVYKNSALWDYKVTLINNESNTVNYEYWTCTTLAPGSVSGDTGTPLNSEIVIPVEEYFAGWSPGAWIGNNNSFYDFENINYLNEWDDMGIAYAHELDDVYWGVINHENEEGIFRISDNIETFGLKLWTWGKNNVDNNLYDFSNGGADNYIELWAGTSKSFFTDAFLSANEVKSWNEAYYPTIGLSSVDNMNNLAAVNLLWDEESGRLDIQLNTFQALEEYFVKIFIDDVVNHSIYEDYISFKPLGYTNSFSLEDLGLSDGMYEVKFELYDTDEVLALEHTELIEVSTVLSAEVDLDLEEMLVQEIGYRRLGLQMPYSDDYLINITSLNGRMVFEGSLSGTHTALEFPSAGVFIISAVNEKKMFIKKVYVR